MGNVTRYIRWVLLGAGRERSELLKVANPRTGHRTPSLAYRPLSSFGKERGSARMNRQQINVAHRTGEAQKEAVRGDCELAADGAIERTRKSLGSPNREGGRVSQPAFSLPASTAEPRRKLAYPGRQKGSTTRIRPGPAWFVNPLPDVNCSAQGNLGFDTSQPSVAGFAANYGGLCRRALRGGLGLTRGISGRTG